VREIREQQRILDRRAAANRARQAVRSVPPAPGISVSETIASYLQRPSAPRTQTPQVTSAVRAQGAFSLEEIAENPAEWIERYPDIDPEFGLDVLGHDEL